MKSVVQRVGNISRRVQARAARAVLLLAALMAWTGCAQFASVSESIFMMSESQEKEFGAKVQGEVAKEYKMLNDPEVVEYVRDLGGAGFG